MKNVAGYIQRKTMLYKTGVEYGDYTMNHVQGCSHGCKYPCYAFLMAKRFGKCADYDEWIKPYLVSNTLAAANRREIDNTAGDEQKSEERIESIYSEEEQRLLQRNRILSLNATFEGVNVLIEEVSAANEHTKIVDSTIAGLNVCVETRTYDVDVRVSLHKIEVLDCIQTASRRTNKYLVLSQPINKKGEICPEEDSKLVRVNVGIVNEASPDYAKAESDVRLELIFGVLSGRNHGLDWMMRSHGVSPHDLSSASFCRSHSRRRGYQTDQ